MRSAVIVVGLLAICVLGPVGTALAESMESLQGAWAMMGTSCTDTFEFSGSEAKFKDRGSSLNTGIIIRGDKIAGPNATCTASHISESKGQYKVHMSCADAIMFSSVTVSFAIVDPQHFRRIDPDFPEVTDDYQKCIPPQ
jgi:hypothetical protein